MTSRTKELAKVIDDDVVTGQMVNNGAIVESGSNTDGEYVRWENGLQLCFISSLNLQNGGVSIQSVQGINNYRAVNNPGWNLPASFINSNYSVNAVDATSPATRSIANTIKTYDYSNSFVNVQPSSFAEITDTDILPTSITAWGYYK